MARPRHRLTDAERQRIARYKLKHPYVSMALLAEEFNCTEQQARRAWQAYKDGSMKKPPGTRRPRKRMEDLMNEKDADELLLQQFHEIIAELAAKSQRTLEDRLSILKDLTEMRKKIQQVSLTAHMKRTDAGIVAIIIKRYEPDASEDEIIKIYKEAVEQFNRELQS